MKTGLEKIIDNRAKVLAGISKLASTRVMVGVPADKGARQDGGPINNAALAYIHDKGAPEAGIPARPFLRPGIDSAKDRIVKGLEGAGKAALQGEVVVEQRLTAVGLVAQAAIRAQITDGAFAPLKESTIEARRRRGRTGTKPLIDTGQLRNSINFVIRKGKG